MPIRQAARIGAAEVVCASTGNTSAFRNALRVATALERIARMLRLLPSPAAAAAPFAASFAADFKMRGAVHAEIAATDITIDASPS